MPLDSTFTDRLPPVAANRLAALRAAHSKAVGVANWASDQRTKAREAVERIDAERARLASRRTGNANIDGEMKDRIEALNADRETAEEALREANSEAATAEDTAAQIGRALHGVRSWLRGLPAEAMLTDDAPKALKSLEQAQAARDEIEAEIHEVRSAPLPASEAVEVARAMVDRLAEAGRPNMSQTLEAGLPPSWDRIAPIYGVTPGDSEFTAALPMAVTAWMFRDQILEALTDEIEAQADDDNALTSAARAARLARLTDKLRTAERVEVATHHAVNGEADWTMRDELHPAAILLVKVAG